MWACFDDEPKLDNFEIRSAWRVGTPAGNLRKTNKNLEMVCPVSMTSRNF